MCFWRRRKRQRAGGGGGGARSALKEREAGAKGPRPALFCLAGPGGGRPPGPPNAAAPPGSLGSCRPFDLSVISRPISCLQTKRAASKERRASASCRKSKEAFQLVFPRFFKSGREFGGGAPGGAWGGAPQPPCHYRLRYRSIYWRALLSQVKCARIPRVIRLRQEAG